MKVALLPAELCFDGDGTPRSGLYDDVYCSRQGGAAQAYHVFIDGNELPERWKSASDEAFVILETGFGLGTNFLSTCECWQESGPKRRLHYIATELHPLTAGDISTLLAERSDEVAQALIKQWPLPLAGVHRLEITNNIVLTLLFGDSASSLKVVNAGQGIDAVFLDGFTPEKNPAMWSADLLKAVTRLCKVGATLATWCVAGEVRRQLVALGWQAERRPGFAHKREMLIARRLAPQIARSRRHAVPPASTPMHRANEKREAIIIGAGIAGCLLAERLCARGWHVSLLEQHADIAAEASGNPVGILLPRLAKDDAISARLSRASYFYALRYIAALDGVDWSPCGVLQIAESDGDAAYQRACIEFAQFPASFVAFLTRDEAQDKLGEPCPWQLRRGGWWFPQGGWINPKSICAAAIHRARENLSLRLATRVARIDFSNDNWTVIDDKGHLLASAPFVILANASAAGDLLPASLRPHIPLDSVRGQITLLDRASNPDLCALPFALCGAGYITPEWGGTACLGASFNRDEQSLFVSQADHADNLRRLEDMLPGASKLLNLSTLAGRVGFRTTTPDRLPLAGALPDPDIRISGDPGLDGLPRLPGLHVLSGLGSRGMMWAPLAAETLASQLAGEPLPVEKRFADSLDPARFYLRHVRRNPVC
jgi:tRNA 5-methylaminomethyl-2-thiouridine biosynthesis bifunctional protein